ncbi:N-acetylglucosamine-6-phosphate deacetylase [Actinobacteria bacterium YIM 96077]|uniref:N-acetylglucosamine-6-phosphate deacetylase n=1 Tax=Phytoactinopolyspora halophila TaxID=1981511 RepID=A0A329R0S7_9ACTN|nr:N-acetylglucosamine-6-phosphate deacetylase [Phytoactinopolyspora halophila]AYY11543.1 N-acetylglucosamine-6-phosphate deacetylase [Actinobacteria bacterium YIM 96077]RAW17973.1 N-acetylglucosamine-6-phosphate deacetylase [Phytoactinopolyspora halophila]
MTVIAGGSVVTSHGPLDGGWVRIQDGRIAAIGQGAPPYPADTTFDGWLVPGFVDIHSHGGGGASVVGGDHEDVRTFAETHRRHGTTTLMASLVTGFPDDLERDVHALADMVDDGLVAGIHLEGPWISPQRRGAHDPHALAAPDPSTVRRLLDAGRGRIRMVTLAPELDQGMAAVREIADTGAIAAIGHTDSSFDVAREAIDAGATVATHLFNAMAPVHHRNPGPIVALLDDPRVTVELILDGAHVHEAIAAHVHRSAGAERIALVTDAMSAAGAGDGDYVLGDLAVRVEDGIARLVDGGSIAGSTLTMDQAFRFAVTRANFSIADAVHAASTTPARALGIAHRTGAISEGYDADLVLLDDELTVQAVMVRGTWVAS